MAVIDTQHGFRLSLLQQQRPSTEAHHAADDCLQYTGEISLDAQRYPLTFTVLSSGEILCENNEIPAQLVERARLIVRASLKQQKSLELPPPRRITRWRAAR